jgi:hypothetical protein
MNIEAMRIKLQRSALFIEFKKIKRLQSSGGAACEFYDVPNSQAAPPELYILIVSSGFYKQGAPLELLCLFVVVDSIFI